MGNKAKIYLIRRKKRRNAENLAKARAVWRQKLLEKQNVQQREEGQDLQVQTWEIMPEPTETLTVEFTEIGNSVPFKVIKIEPCDEPSDSGVQDPLLTGLQESIRTEEAEQSAWMNSAENCPGPSNIDRALKRSLCGTSSPTITKQKKTESELSFEPTTTVSDTSHVASGHEESCSDGDSDMECDTQFNTNSECEYVSEFDDLNGSGHDSSSDDDSDDGATNNRTTTDTPTWSTLPKNMKKLKLNANKQLLISPPQDPYQAFRLFFDDKLLDKIVQETNKNAALTCSNPSLGPKARFQAWKELNRDELVVFLGLFIHTGTIRMNCLSDYWKRDYLFNLTCFSKFMNRNRFMLILNSLSFSSDEAVPGTDSLANIRPIMDSFNEKMNAMYSPGKQLYLAKTLTFWQDQMVCNNTGLIRRHNKLELLTLAEPNGVVIKYLVHDGSRREPSTKIPKERVVLELLKEKLDKGHAVYMDEDYNSYKLAVQLLDRQTYCTGPLDKVRRGNPFKRKNYKLKNRENKSLFLNGIHIGKWKSRKRSILYISTEYNNELVTFLDGSVMKLKPKALAYYNKFMKSSELHKQLMSYHPFCGSQTIRWHKKVFIRSLQMCLNNAFQLFNGYSGRKKMPYHDFRLCILRAMLPEPLVAPPNSLQGKHSLTKITRTKTRVRKGYEGRVITEVIRKHCKVCRLKKKVTATAFECLGCEGAPGYCPSCFCEIHAYRP